MDTPDKQGRMGLRLVPSVEDDGGQEYLFERSRNTAYLQRMQAHEDWKNSDSWHVFADEETGVTNTVTISKDARIFTSRDSIIKDKTYLLFEGTGIGKGRLLVEIIEAGEVKARGEIWLKLVDVKQLYQHYTVGDYVGGDPSDRASEINGVADSDLTKFGQTSDYILVVHGWNMNQFERRAFAETSFKRLYWQNYQGRVGLFSWPTTAVFSTLDYFRYPAGEYIAWRSAEGLRKLMVSLSSPYNLHVMAHSLGNVVVSEALRREAVTDGRLITNTFVASQAASVAHAYDGDDLLTVDDNTNTPEVYADYPPTHIPYFAVDGISNIGHAAGAIINLHNAVDHALNRPWKMNQAAKPIVYEGYFYDSLSMLWLHRGEQDPVLVFPDDTYEIYSYIAEARSNALGAESRTRGMIQAMVNLNIAPYNYGDRDYEHSAQFRSVIMKRSSYWEYLLHEAFDIR
jgi:hypothetical protein